jgi:VanZ family protein
MRWLRYWGPVVIWAAIISIASTGSFSSDKTAGHILPILQWLLRHANRVTLEEIHHLIRKGGHVFEYFIFTMLLFYAIRAGRAGWRASWMWITLVCVASYAGLDEFHQSFVPGRGASVWDALLDTSAGALAMVVIWIWWRRRKRRERPEPGEQNYAARSR